MRKNAHYQNVMKAHGYKSMDELKQNTHLNMFEAFTSNGRHEAMKDYFVCCMRMDGVYYQELVRRRGEGNNNNSSSSSSPSSSSPLSLIALPEGAVPLEATSEEVARIIVDLLVRFGGGGGVNDQENSTSSSTTTKMYRLPIVHLRDLVPLLKLNTGKDLNDLQSFITFLESHPDKFYLISSGRVVNSVVLNYEYLTKMMNERSYEDDEEEEQEQDEGDYEN